MLILDFRIGFVQKELQFCVLINYRSSLISGFLIRGSMLRMKLCMLTLNLYMIVLVYVLHLYNYTTVIGE